MKFIWVDGLVSSVSFTTAFEHAHSYHTGSDSEAIVCETCLPCFHFLMFSATFAAGCRAKIVEDQCNLSALLATRRRRCAALRRAERLWGSLICSRFEEFRLRVPVLATPRLPTTAAGSLPQCPILVA